MKKFELCAAGGQQAVATKELKAAGAQYLQRQGSYAFSSDSAQHNNASHTVTAKAIDEADNEATSAGLSVTVDTAAGNVPPNRVVLDDLWCAAATRVAARMRQEGESAVEGADMATVCRHNVVSSRRVEREDTNNSCCRARQHPLVRQSSAIVFNRTMWAPAVHAGTLLFAFSMLAGAAMTHLCD